MDNKKESHILMWEVPIVQEVEAQGIRNQNSDQIKNEDDQENEAKVLKGHQDTVTDLAVTYDNKHLFSGSDDRTVLMWNIQDLSENRYNQPKLEINSPVTAVELLAQDQKLAVTSKNGVITGYDVPAISKNKYQIKDKSKKLREKMIAFQAHDLPINAVVGMKTKPSYLTCSDDQTIKMWHMKDLEHKEYQPEELEEYIISVKKKHENPQKLNDLDLKNDFLDIMAVVKEECVLSGHDQGVKAIKVSKNEKFLFSASMDTTIKMWSIEQRIEMDTFVGHSLTVQALSISHDDSFLFSGSNDFDIKLWSIRENFKKNIEREVKTQDCQITALAINPAGDTIITSSEEKTVALTSLKDFSQIQKAQEHESKVSVVVFEETEGCFYASGGSDQKVIITNSKT